MLDDCLVPWKYFTAILSLFLLLSDGVFDRDELVLASMQILRENVIALYLCKSLSDDTYGKHLRVAGNL